MRPQTYESAEEAKILSYVFAGRSGLENTSFALLDPEGKKLTRGSRSPSMLYPTTGGMVDAMNETVASYAEKAKAIKALPTLRNLRLGLNVAAADMRPLIVIRAEGEQAALELAKRVADLSWSVDLIGRSHYVILTEEVSFESLTPAMGVSVIAPDPYGLGGEVLAHVKATTTDKKLSTAILDGISKHQPEAREHDDHVREARERGIEWETAIPVTDSHGSREKR